ncbi:FtsK/SpoIIIE domain-containing protein [Fictibacillus nanhaiensis]|uniref:FtsK/SpoIIIE domain-containing protein n=1 Tax=Fictibacillus nanhaiensis TaxID=742169 RepID=UPI003C1BF37B
MILEFLSSAVMGSIVGYGYYLKQNGATNDAAKMQRIFRNCGLVVKENGKEGNGKITREVQLYRRKKEAWGTEYIYRIPLGLSFSDFEKKLDHIKDGLNNKKAFIDINMDDIKGLNLKENIPNQLKSLLEQKKNLHKNVDLTYDGMLRVKVFNQSIPKGVEYQEKSKGWKILVGKTHYDEVFHDFEEIPHMVVGGATRYGKSNFLNSMIMTLLKNNPNNVTFTLIDLKGGNEFGDYEHLKHVVGYAEEPEDAEIVLENAVNLMIKKRKEMRRKGFRNVQKAKDPHRHFVIIDEVGELNPEEAITKEEKKMKERCQTYMSKIARLGAGWGFRQILATQYPTGDIIPRQCKQNSDAKLCFRVQNGIASKVVLDDVGAEDLPLIKGRAIYQMPDRKVILQTPLISDQTINETIKPYIQKKARDPFANTTRNEGGGDSLIDEETWVH